MTAIPPRPTRPSILLALALALPGLAAWQPNARAQDEDEPEPDAAAVNQGFFIDDSNFDMWVFGGRNVTNIRERLALLLTLQIEDVEKVCGLNDAQRRRIELAGRGDIKRLYDRIEEKRKRFQLVKTDQNKFAEFYQELMPIQATISNGPFSEGSIFAKSVRKILDDAQAARYEGALRDRRRFRYRTKVELTVSTLDNAIGLSDDQRRRFVDLVVKETRPPRRFGQNDNLYMLHQIATIPEAKLKPLFDDVQWRSMARQIQQAKGWDQWLKSAGFVPEDEEPKEKDKEKPKP